MGRVVVLFGVFIGEYEVVELCDGGKDYMGKGVLKVVENVNGKIVGMLLGILVFE